MRDVELDGTGTGRLEVERREMSSLNGQAVVVVEVGYEHPAQLGKAYRAGAVGVDAGVACRAAYVQVGVVPELRTKRLDEAV